MAMQAVIKELKMIPGVLGGFFYHRQGGLLFSDLPTLFKEAKLIAIGRQLGRIAATRHLNFPDIIDINLYVEDVIVATRVVQERLNLILICEPSVNTGTLSMAMRIALDEQRGALERLAERLDKEGTLTASDLPLSPEAAVKGPLRGVLEAIEQILADLMGPMAELIFEETLEQWIAAGQADAARLPQLIDMLAGEMADEAKAAALRDGFNALSH